MPLLEVANTDRVMTITPLTGATVGTATYVQNESSKVKINNKGIIVGTINWTMNGCTSGVSVLINGSGSMDPTANKVTEKILNMKPIRKTDTGQCNGTMRQVVFPFAYSSCNCRFDVTDAGQTKCKAQ